jgi:hypothetical protein
VADQFATVQQEISAGNDWDGTVPATTPVIADGIKAYPAHTAGGLFEFGLGEGFFLWRVERIVVDFNGVANKGVYIRKSGVPDIPVWESTLAIEAKLLFTDKVQLAADEQLVVVSTGAANAMYARVTARPVLARP